MRSCTLLRSIGSSRTTRATSPRCTWRAAGVSAGPKLLSRAARTSAGAPFELGALDVAWRSGRGGILARCGGTRARRRAERVGTAMREAGLGQVEVATDDAELWARQ